MNKFLILLLGISLFCSCKKKEINPLKDTTWIHEFKESEHVDAKADAYCFGADEVEHYAIGQNGKISRRLSVSTYSFRKGILTIGAGEHKYSEHSLYLNGKLYVKTTKDIFNMSSYSPKNSINIPLRQ